MRVKEIWNNVVEFTDRNSPVILTGMGVGGVFATAYMAYKAGPKAHDILQKYHEDKKLIKEGDKETKKAVLQETVKELAPVLVPPILMGVATSACIIGGNRISTKRVAVLSAAYSIADSKLKDYQDRMLETLGEQKTQKVREAIAKKDLEEGYTAESQQIVIGDGKVLCKDSHTRRYFQSSAEEIGSAINSLTADVLSDMYVSLNDFYDKLGLEPIPLGDDLGWNVDDAVGGKLPIYFTACLTPDNKPCLVVEYDIRLREDFRNLH